MFKRYRRAQKWLHEKNCGNQEAFTEAEDNELPSMEELRAQANEEVHLDKSDWFALLLAATVNVFIPCVLFLLFIVAVGMWIF